MSSELNINDLEHKGIARLLWKYVMPSVVITISMALYYIINSIYIGFGPGLGDHALGGMGIVLPILNILASLGTLVGVGASTRVSIYLGKKDEDSAKVVIGTSIMLTLLLTFIPMLFIYFFADYFLLFMGAPEETYAFAKEFLYYYLPAGLFLNMGMTLSNIMKATGYPGKAMNYMSIGVVLNVLIAPLFIFVFEWGMKGAALASSIATFIGFVFFVVHFLTKDGAVWIKKEYLRIEKHAVWDICSIGLAPFLIQGTYALSMSIVNNRISLYGGAVGLEAYTIANRVILIFIMCISGISQGMQPIIGYNYGAKNYERVKKTLIYTINLGVIVGAVGMVVSLLLKTPLISIFNPSLELAQLSAFVLIIMAVTLPLSGFQMVIGAFFQNIGMAKKSVLLSLTRQFVFLVPLIYFLPLKFGSDGVWGALPVSEVMGTLFAAVVIYDQHRRLKKAKQLIT